jgi:ABC-type polysaccharide/polyol phosphate export permease
MGRYFADVWKCRYFWLSLVKMDLQLRYRRSVLGIGWSLLHPVASTIVLSIAFHEIFHLSIRDYASFLMAGLAWWGYISGVTIRGCQCFVEAESYIRQHPVPMAVYPLRTALGGMIHFVIALAVVLVLTCCLRGFATLPALPVLAVSLVLLLVFGWSVSVLAGYVNSVFRDIQHLTEIGFQILFYLTPIIYTPKTLEDTPRLAMLVNNNPLGALLTIVREPLLKGTVPEFNTFIAAVVPTVILTAAALLVLGRLQKRVILYL